VFHLVRAGIPRQGDGSLGRQCTNRGCQDLECGTITPTRAECTANVPLAGPRNGSTGGEGCPAGSVGCYVSSPDDAKSGGFTTMGRRNVTFSAGIRYVGSPYR